MLFLFSAPLLEPISTHSTFSWLGLRTRATHLAKFLTEDQLRVYFGWSKGSEVPARYVHLSGRDVDGALAKMVWGLRVSKKRKPVQDAVF
jgi:hypothetical protein